MVVLYSYMDVRTVVPTPPSPLALAVVPSCCRGPLGHDCGPRHARPFWIRIRGSLIFISSYFTRCLCGPLDMCQFLGFLGPYMCVLMKSLLLVNYCRLVGWRICVCNGFYYNAELQLILKVAKPKTWKKGNAKKCILKHSKKKKKNLTAK